MLPVASLMSICFTGNHRQYTLFNHIVKLCSVILCSCVLLEINLLLLLPLQWRHNGLDGVSNHHCLISRLFGRRSKKTSKPRVTGLCEGNSTGTGEFPAQRSSRARNVSVWWRHHILLIRTLGTNFSEVLTEIHTPLFKKMDLKMSSVKWRQFCLGLNVLIHPVWWDYC